MQTQKHTHVQIGTRVYTNLYRRGTGTIYAIDGEQKPETVQTFMGGAGVSGGQAYFDIVFDSGAVTTRLPECILHGVQWNILDQVVTPEFIVEALANAANFAATEETKAREAKDAFDLAVEQLKTSPDHGYLRQQDGFIHSSKLAVINIRASLKKHFKEIKFSVRSDLNSVNISWVDGVNEEQVSKIVDAFHSGRFDGYEDIYKFEKSPFTEVFGSIQYVFTRREASPALIQKAIDALFDQYPSNFEGIVKPTPEDFKAGRTFTTRIPGFVEGLQTEIHRKLANII